MNKLTKIYMKRHYSNPEIGFRDLHRDKGIRKSIAYALFPLIKDDPRCSRFIKSPSDLMFVDTFEAARYSIADVVNAMEIN